MPGGQRVRQVSLRRVEDAFAVRAEPAERHAEREADVIGRRFGIVLGLVRRQRFAFGTVHGRLRPVLGVTPGGRTGAMEFDRGLAVRFVLGERLIEYREELIGIFNRKQRQSINVVRLSK